MLGHLAAPVALESQEIPPRPDAPHPWQTLIDFYLRALFGGVITASLLRPLARRRLITILPPGVAIRARNPWRRRRLRLLG